MKFKTFLGIAIAGLMAVGPVTAEAFDSGWGFVIDGNIKEVGRKIMGTEKPQHHKQKTCVSLDVENGMYSPGHDIVFRFNVGKKQCGVLFGENLAEKGRWLFQERIKPSKLHLFLSIPPVIAIASLGRTLRNRTEEMIQDVFKYGGSDYYNNLAAKTVDDNRKDYSRAAIDYIQRDSTQEYIERIKRVKVEIR